MPELPEVETIRRGLDERLVGQKVREIILGRPDMIVGCPDDFKQTFEGRCVSSTGRRGKVLWLAFDDDGLAVHLGMSGRLCLNNDSDHPPHTHVVVNMQKGPELLYIDPRRFGRLELVNLAAPDGSRVLQNVGVDALDPQWTAEKMLQDAASHSIGIKQFLLDQTHVAGLGNIYVCEILHRAGVRPDRPANRISETEARRIIRNTREILKAAIDAGGTTISDHRDALGRPGRYQECLRVYDREGETCPVSGCAGEIKRSTHAGRSTYHCPGCQE